MTSVAVGYFLEGVVPSIEVARVTGVLLLTILFRIVPLSMLDLIIYEVTPLV